ncbi:MAG: 5'/3'-nucleotidase SurE [Candidatus Neomarinimicrobiota bacterium]
MNERPLILITNDDGIYAPGIYALWEAMIKLGDVFVAAPDTEKSAVGHAITLSDPIRVQKVERKNGFKGYAVAGTPADSVKIAVRALMEREPDLVISGINSGANVGTSLIYSGTVSAATEGTLLNIPSIAISLASLTATDFRLAGRVAESVVARVLKNGLPAGTLLNINVPNVAEDQVRGYKFTRQGDLHYREGFDRREDPRGRVYYWMTGQILEPKLDEDSDHRALTDNYISITPIHYRLTDEDYLREMQNWELP